MSVCRSLKDRIDPRRTENARAQLSFLEPQSRLGAGQQVSTGLIILKDVHLPVVVVPMLRDICFPIAM